MIKKSYQEFPGTKVYFTEADPSCQLSYSMNSADLSVKLKFWLLLADHVILSTGHMIRSDITFSWLHENSKDIAVLSENSAIVSSLSDKYETFGDFVIDQVPSHGFETVSSRVEHNSLERARLLSDLFQESMTWSSVDESKLFAGMMSHHLRDSSSPLRRRMIGVRKAKIYEMATTIEEARDFNRGKLLSIARSYIPERQKIVQKYADCFYYLSGALHKDAFPAMHNEAADLCRETVSYAAGDRHAIESEGLWETISDNWGLSRHTLANISLNDIHKIRKDTLGARLRKTWGSLLKNAHEGLKYSDRISALADIQDALKRLFTVELAKQKLKHQRWQKANDIVQTGAWVTGGLGTLLGLATAPIISAISFTTGILGFLSGPPFINALEKRQKGTELVILSDRIRKLSQTRERDES